VTHAVNLWLLLLADAMQGVGISLALLAIYNVFRVVVLDLSAKLQAGEGDSYIRIAAVTLGVSTTVILIGRALEVIAR
jgi:hypothetical protein